MILNCLKHAMPRLYQLFITALMLTSLEGETKSNNSSTISSSMRPTALVYETLGNTSAEYGNVCCFDLCYNVNAFLFKMNNMRFSEN